MFFFFRKQLSFLESSLESTEMRLKAEIDSINKHFTSKLEELSTEKQNIITNYEEKIKVIHEENISEIKTIQENCKITIADVRNEYKQMLDDMSVNKVKAETSLTEAAVVSRKIDDSLKVLDSNTRVIQELQTKMYDEHNILNDVKSETLNAKEMEIKSKFTLYYTLITYEKYSLSKLWRKYKLEFEESEINVN